MPLPTRIGPGGPFLAPPLATPQSAIFGEEESDGWWAGVNLCGVAVPRASAAAALGLSVAIAGGFVQQDEVVPWLAAEASATSVPTQRARVAPTFVRWHVPDELPITAAAVLEEDYWHRQDVRAPLLLAQVFSDTEEWKPILEEADAPPLVVLRASPQLLVPWAPDDELSRGPAIEEEYALDLRAPLAQVAPQPLTADEELVVTTVAAALDEAEWQRYVPLASVAQPFYLPDPDEAPAGALRGTAEEDYWQPLAPFVVRPLAPLGTADDEIVPQPTTMLDEVYEVRTERAALPSTQLFAWQADELPPASAGFLEETDLPVLQPVLARALSAIWVDEERAPPPTLGVEDEYHWAAGSYSAPRVAVLGYAAPEEDYVPPLVTPSINEDYHWAAGAYNSRVAMGYDLTGADAEMPTPGAVLASLARTYVVPVQKRLRAIALQGRTRVIALQTRIRVILAQYRSK